jgi:hypothetical protein
MMNGRALSGTQEKQAMCMTVYMASDYSLPTSAWDEACPTFYVRTLTEGDEPVRRQFSKPYVYYAGSHEGCGCGFQYGQYEGCEEDAAALAAAQGSRRKLAEFLSLALQHQATVEVFACWDGDQGAPPEHRGHARPVDLVRGCTFFNERELLVMSESSLEPVATQECGGD